MKKADKLNEIAKKYNLKVYLYSGNNEYAISKNNEVLYHGKLKDIKDYLILHYGKINIPLNFPASKGMTYIGRWFKYIGDEDGDDYGKPVRVVGGELSRDEKSVLLFRCKTKDGQDVDAFPMELVEIKGNPTEKRYGVKVWAYNTKPFFDSKRFSTWKKAHEWAITLFWEKGADNTVVWDFKTGKMVKNYTRRTQVNPARNGKHVPDFARQSIDQAKKSYKEFTWRNPDDIFKGQLPIYKGERLIYIGQVTKLWYKSDKFDRVQRIHCHDFKRPHMVFTNKARTLLYIYPCVINSRGIID